MAKRTAILVAPTLEEVLRQGVKIGLPTEEAEEFFWYYSSNGWRVGKVPMKCWLSALSGWRCRWLKRKGESVQRVNGAEKMVMEKEYERVIARMKEIPKVYDEHRKWSEAHRLEFGMLKTRRDELRSKLGIMI